MPQYKDKEEMTVFVVTGLTLRNINDVDYFKCSEVTQIKEVAAAVCVDMFS